MKTLKNQPNSFLNRLGVRPNETSVVSLFFFHHFFLGIASILVYVSANVILLENHPETSLPLAYIVSAICLMIVGRIYAHFEHTLELKSLVFRALIAVIAISLLIFLLLFLPTSVREAVTIMVGYRIIYLLTNLEYWATSAIIFDIRQSKRLFSIISSGDMPAKALGAVLAALIHSHTALFYLLGGAFLFFIGAIFILKRTLQVHKLHSKHTPIRIYRKPTSKIIQQLFGGNQLIFLMCLGLGAISTIAVSIEYEFFVNVKHRFHNQAELTKYIGIVLCMTYLPAMFVKLFLTTKVFERIGIISVLRLLPAVVLVCMIFYFGASFTQHDDTFYLIYYGGMYLVFEVIRRALFDPVFLVLFQPLPQHQRLAGHTLAKGYYEPLGMLNGGIFFYLFLNHFSFEHLPFIWMAVSAIAAFLLFNKAYHRYLEELKDAFSKRFVEADELSFSPESLDFLTQNLSSEKSIEVLTALHHIEKVKPEFVIENIEQLLKNNDPKVRAEALEIIKNNQLDFSDNILENHLFNEKNDLVREKIGFLLSKITFLESEDLALKKGTIEGCIEKNIHLEEAKKQLNILCLSEKSNKKQLALEIIGSQKLEFFYKFINKSLTENDENLVKEAIRISPLKANDETIIVKLFELLKDKKYTKNVAESLALMNEKVVETIENDFGNSKQKKRLIEILSKINSQKSYNFLVKIAQNDDLKLRLLALKALKNNTAKHHHTDIFKELLQKEFSIALYLLDASDKIHHKDFSKTIQYEIRLLTQRVFGILIQLYDKNIVSDAQNSVEHDSVERRGTALEMLENLIPHKTYKCLQVLIDNGIHKPEKISTLANYLNEKPSEKPLLEYILEKGESHFTDWTIFLTLKYSEKNHKKYSNEIKQLSQAKSRLVQNKAQDLLKENTTMKHSTEDKISDFERILVLQNTNLFAETPENVLSSITPIMKEVSFSENQTIFKKGDDGNCMYIIYSGEIGIMDGEKQLAKLQKGDYFGELALLDTEPRSATVIAKSDVFLFRIDQEDFYDLMEEREEVMRNIIKKLSQLIRDLNKRVK